MCVMGGTVPGSVAEALRMADASMDYLNSPAAADLPAAACGQALTALGEIHAKFTAARVTLLRRFDALDGHDGDGYGTSAAWLAAMTKMATKDAKAAVGQMRRLGGRRLLGRRAGPRRDLRVLGGRDPGPDQEAAGGDARRHRPHPAGGGRRGRVAG